jgi:hypothetical protein
LDEPQYSRESLTGQEVVEGEQQQLGCYRDFVRLVVDLDLTQYPVIGGGSGAGHVDLCLPHLQSVSVYYLFDAFALDLVTLVIALTAGGGIMTETEMKPR